MTPMLELRPASDLERSKDQAGLMPSQEVCLP